MIDTSELMSDPDFCESFTALRSQNGQFIPGGFYANRQPVSLYGVVQVADADTLEQVPEGDRTSGARVFWSNAQIYESTGTPSDVLTYHGYHWKVVRVWDRSANGFWKAYATRIEAA